MNLIEFEKFLQKSWSKETSYFPKEWSKLNPSFGQCGVTALVVNDFFGGEIVWAEVLLPTGEKVSHYFNVIEGKEVDLTRTQFSKGTFIPKGVEKKKDFSSTRAYVLSNDSTKKRYELLKKKMRNSLSYFIIIRGPLGSGKSTISDKLAHVLDARLIHVDEVLDSHGLDIIPPDAPCIPAENFIKANEVVLPEVKRLLDSGKVVIFDGCFYHQEVIEHLIKNLPYEQFVFTLKAPVELCIQRDRERQKTYGEAAAQAVHSLVSRFDYGIAIDVTGTMEDAIAIIISYLKK